MHRGNTKCSGNRSRETQLNGPGREGRSRLADLQMSAGIGMDMGSVWRRDPVQAEDTAHLKRQRTAKAHRTPTLCGELTCGGRC